MAAIPTPKLWYLSLKDWQEKTKNALRWAKQKEKVMPYIMHRLSSSE